MNKIFFINRKKTTRDDKNGVIQENGIDYPCLFTKIEDAEKALEEISKNRGYKTYYNEDGVLTGSIFNNVKRGVTIVLTVEQYTLVDSYEDFMQFVQSYESGY